MGGKFKDRQRQKQASKATGRRGATPAQLRRSNRQGASLEDRWEARLRERYKYVFKKVDIQANRPPGARPPGPGSSSPPPKTSGAVPEADFLVGDSLDDLHPVEIKKGPKSGQTKNQRLGYPNVNKRGGRVVTEAPQKNLNTGKLHNLRVRKLKPGRFIRLYEVDVVAIEAGQTTLDDIVEKRKGVLHPKPTPLQLPPAFETGTGSDSDGKNNRGNDEKSRGRSRPAKGTSDTGRRPGSATDARATNPSKQTTTPTKTSTPTATSKRAPVSKSNVPNVRLKAGRAAFRIGRGLIIDQLVSLAVGLFVNYFEKKVAEENQRHIDRNWREKVFPKVEPYMERAIELAEEGLMPRKSPYYISVGWTVIMQELDEDASDAIVWAGKFLAGDPGFGEVYYDLEVGDYIGEFIYRGKGAPKSKAHKRQRDPRRDDLLRYGFTQYILVHDPQVLKVAKDFRSRVEHQRKLLKQVDEGLANLDSNNNLGPQIRRIDEKLQEYSFTGALRLSSELFKTIENKYFFGRQSITAPLKQLIDQCNETIVDQVPWLISFTRDQRNLLNAMLGARVGI